MRRLELYHLVGNGASGRVAEKVAFKREGVLHAYAVIRSEPCDCVMYALIPSDLAER